MNKSIVISGEASETDSEDEHCIQTSKSEKQFSAVKGAVITGEDSESENENDASVASAISALNECTTSESPKNVNDSLFHLKLRESNGKLHQDIESLSQNAIGDANKNLHIIDQHLAKSQVTLQAAVNSLKSLSANSLAIKNKLQLLISGNFIPNIKFTK